MAARARPRTAPAASRPVSAGGQGRLLDRGLEAARMDDEQGSISYENDASEDRDKRGEYHVLEWVGDRGAGEATTCCAGGSSPAADEQQHQQQQQQRCSSSAWESGGSGVARSAPVSVSMEEEVSGEQEGGDGQGGKGGSPSGRARVTSSPGRRSWGAGFRMYV